MTVYTGERLTLLEHRIGRHLTAAETHIQVETIDQLLNHAKDLLDAAIRTEQARAARAIADGQNARLEVTARMRQILADLRKHGQAHAQLELDSMGYPVRDRRRFATEDELAGQLRARLGQLTVKVQTGMVGLDLSALSQNAIQDALAKILGARSIAADLVSPAFVSGLADTFEQHADLVEQWQYTAVNDAGLCEECAPHDGEVFDSLDALFEVLPNFGPNPDCLGGDRCRCRAVPVPPDGDIVDRQDVTPPSGLFNLGQQRTPTANTVRDALAAIDHVHTVPGDAPSIPIKVTGELPPSNPGQYAFKESGEPVGIKISTYADDPAFTAAHEVGHYVDHQIVGTRGVFASSGEASELAAWQEAVNGTEAVQTLRRMRDDPAAIIRVTVPDRGTVNLPVENRFVDYLLQPEELFARSYAQWIASASTDPVLRRDLTRAQRLPYPEQWTDADFTMVARAFERLMEAQGWTNPTR